MKNEEKAAYWLIATTLTIIFIISPLVLCLVDMKPQKASKRFDVRPAKTALELNEAVAKQKRVVKIVCNEYGDFINWAKKEKEEKGQKINLNLFIAKKRYEQAQRRYGGRIKMACQKYGVPPKIATLVMVFESNLDEKAVSHKGAKGLMQLHPKTAKAMGVRDPFHPGDNIYGGVKYLRRLYDRFGSWKLALAAYNAGPTIVERLGRVPRIKETEIYLAKIYSLYNEV